MAQLRDRRITEAPGTYIAGSESRAPLEHETADQYYDRWSNARWCKVCALGAMLISAVKQTQILPDRSKFFFWHRIQPLEALWNQRELMLIEDAYECGGLPLEAIMNNIIRNGGHFIAGQEN